MRIAQEPMIIAQKSMTINENYSGIKWTTENHQESMKITQELLRIIRITKNQWEWLMNQWELLENQLESPKNQSESLKINENHLKIMRITINCQNQWELPKH